MHMSSKLIREPRQARSRETLSRIVEATLSLSRESLDGGFTLREVADRADIARGTLPPVSRVRKSSSSTCTSSSGPSASSA